MQHEHLTDLGNAKRLVERHGEDLRYVPEWKSWLAWDGTRWALDVSGEAMRRAKKTARSMLEEAIEIPDKKTREIYVQHALRTESSRALKAMIELATTEPGIPVGPSELDAGPWLLNCPNGTLNLRTAVLQPHRREDLITKICSVPYDQDAECSVFSEFLNRVLPDAELRQFVQRAAGYSLSGKPDAETFFFVYGPTASGKSTLLEGVKSTLGDYAATADFESFLQRRDTGGPRQDIARLAGTRFVASVEIDDAKRLASGLVKLLTGGDTVVARYLYGREFEFQPQFTLWLAANDEPKVRDDDQALWRRILEVPFTEAIPEDEQDPTVKSTICDPKGSGPAVLAWAVAGCLEYQQVGLLPPDAVKRATEGYRERMDPLADWIEECLTITSNATATADQLYTSYKMWCDGARIKRPMSRRSLGRRLSNKGWKPDEDEKRTRHGIGVRAAGS